MVVAQDGVYRTGCNDFWENNTVLSMCPESGSNSSLMVKDGTYYENMNCTGAALWSYVSILYGMA